MIKLPIRFRSFQEQMLVTSEGGDFAFLEGDFIERFLEDRLSTNEIDLALSKRFLAFSDTDWRVKSLSLQARKKNGKPKRQIRYFMVVPTLRCNLACSYCQVSRAPLSASGFDWETRHLLAFERFLEDYAAPEIKIEFQGGEVSLRPDLIREIEAIAKRYCSKVELVACTNLYKISPEFEGLFNKENFYLSTSLDGDVDAMSANRTNDVNAAQENIENIRRVIQDYGIDKISFLPTITKNNISNPAGLINLYESIGASGIFLRPVNYQGFARKQHDKAASGFEEWKSFFEEALEVIKLINKKRYFEEVYVADLIRSIFLRRETDFIDFRSPSRFLSDMAVIDFDGTIYPTDESRMLTRTRHIDLSVGSIFDGLDEEKISQLNMVAMKEVNPDCVHCAYLPYCGVDVIDDLSRYNRIDLPKSETWYCNKQTFFFDWIFDKIQREDMEWLPIFAKWAYRKENTSPNVDALIA